MHVVDSLLLIDLSGYLIIATIVTFLALCIGLTIFIRRQYWRLELDLDEHADSGMFQSALLVRIVREAREQRARGSAETNTQAIIEQHFYAELDLLLIGERLVKASTGLMIILGLVGTFYGLSSSIGKLVSLVSQDLSAAEDLTQSLTQALTQTLTGMSIAFSASLFGIVAAIVMTLVNALASIADRRMSVMVKIETYLDRICAVSTTPRTDADVANFGAAVMQLHEVVQRFEASMQGFSSSTRDFREFNGHLKDNIQRMSLGFAELSDTLQAQVDIMKPRVRS